MSRRRVVTGHDKDLRAVVISDGPAPRTHDFVSIPGFQSSLVWATEADQEISREGADPTAAVTAFEPGPGASRFIILRLPPASVFAAEDFDPAAATAEQIAVSPGLAEKFEPDGMHTTDTVDYVIVLAGEVWMVLGGGEEVRLTAGDVVIQNGTRHSWQNRTDQPASLAAILIGARRFS